MITKFRVFVGVVLFASLLTSRLPFSTADVVICGWKYGSWTCDGRFGWVPSSPCGDGSCGEFDYNCDRSWAYSAVGVPDAVHDDLITVLEPGEEYYNLGESRKLEVYYVVCAELNSCNTECEFVGDVTAHATCTKSPWLSIPIGALAVSQEGDLCNTP